MEEAMMIAATATPDAAAPAIERLEPLDSV